MLPLHGTEVCLKFAACACEVIEPSEKPHPGQLTRPPAISCATFPLDGGQHDCEYLCDLVSRVNSYVGRG
jgi:hypothetical protein